jgi:hypothetical protein
MSEPAIFLDFRLAGMTINEKISNKHNFRHAREGWLPAVRMTLCDFIKHIAQAVIVDFSLQSIMSCLTSVNPVVSIGVPRSITDFRI